MEFRMCCQSLLVLSLVVFAYGDDYEGLSKIWSTRGVVDPQGSRTSVVGVSSEPLAVVPNGNPSAQPTAHSPERYAFHPRAIPLRPEQSRNIQYSHGSFKVGVQPPDSLYQNEPRVMHITDDVEAAPHKPLSLFSENGERRSFDNDIVSPMMAASRRSLSYILGGEDEDGDEEGIDGEYEEEEEESADNVKEKHYKHKLKPKKPKKLGKYMLPLLLAYKMKYFAMVPVMIGGLVLLVGATGLAGFFFALFAAVMGLQKGSY